MSSRVVASTRLWRWSLFTGLTTATTLASCIGGTTGREKLDTRPAVGGTAPGTSGTSGTGSSNGGSTGGISGAGGSDLASNELGGAGGIPPDDWLPFGGYGDVGGADSGITPGNSGAGGGGDVPVSAWCDGKLCTDSAACNACLQTNLDNTNCEGVFPPCSSQTGNAKDGPAATSPKLELCQATYACAQRTKCYRDNLADCYCGSASGVACLGTGAANGPCQAEIEAGLETTDPAAVAQHLTSTEYAAGAAMLLMQCAQQYCVDECVTGAATGAGGAAP